MCGIVGYIGSQEAYPILISGLKRLEYRGYDSSGIALMDHEQVCIFKYKGRVVDLERKTSQRYSAATIGMGHTRWATHGEPNDVNAHPHTSMNNLFSIIHNGIIENHALLKRKLSSRDYIFKSETDTEILVNLIEYIYLKGAVSAEDAVRLALTKVIGAYGIVVMCHREPDKLIVARKGSPIVIGIGQNEYFVASDATPIVEYTKNVIYMNDDNIAILKRDEIIIKTIHNDSIIPIIQQIDLDIEKIEKGGFPHFMLKEIHEQADSIFDTIRGRVNPSLAEVFLGGISHIVPQLTQAKRIIIVGCGTSWHAGLVGEFLIEEFARIPVEVEYASEFRYRNPIITAEDIVIAISQSGETADTLAAIKHAREKGAVVIGICNVVGSSIARATDAGVYTHAGPEIGVASTKAFTAQIAVLSMMALLIGHTKGTLQNSVYREYVRELYALPEKIKEIIAKNEAFKEIALAYKDSTNAIYLGRGCQFPVALEGALKLKEISYIHAEGYPAAEMKHGPIALIDENMPVFAIATHDNYYDKIVSNTREVQARKGHIIALINPNDSQVKEIATHFIEIPETLEFLSPLLNVIPLQLISYHIAVMRGCDVDMPRNLAKSVTVE